MAMIPFKQVPHWEPNTKFELDPEEFAQMMTAYEQLTTVVQTIYNRHIENGKLKMKYYDDFDNELSEETVRDMMNHYNNIVEEKAPN